MDLNKRQGGVDGCITLVFNTRVRRYLELSTSCRSPNLLASPCRCHLPEICINFSVKVSCIFLPLYQYCHTVYCIKMAVSADGTQHVPAWKRLGLKLKNAAETPTESNNESNVQQNRAHGDTSQIARISDDRLSKGKTSKRSRDDSGESHDSKKRRISNADHASLNVSSPAASKQIIEHSTDTPAKASLDDAELSK